MTNYEDLGEECPNRVAGKCRCPETGTETGQIWLKHTEQRRELHKKSGPQAGASRGGTEGKLALPGTTMGLTP